MCRAETKALEIKKMLDEFKTSSDKPTQQMIDVLMKLHKVWGDAEFDLDKLVVSVGHNIIKDGKIKAFNSILTSISECGYTVLTVCDNQLQILIQERSSYSDVTILTINLSDISNISYKVCNGLTTKYITNFHSNKDNVDYNISIVVKNK